MMYQAYQNHMDLTAPWRTRGRIGAEISQPGAAGRLRQAVRAARRRARTDLTHLADLYAARPTASTRCWSATANWRSPRRSSTRRRSARCCISRRTIRRSSRAAAGGADVRPFRHAVARHREDAAAGSRRLHHRLAQSARHSARSGQVRPRRIHRAPDHLPRPAGPARAHGGDLPAVGVGARRRRHHVGGQSSGAAGDA